jgi:hypothetical protein
MPSLLNSSSIPGEIRLIASQCADRIDVRNLVKGNPFRNSASPPGPALAGQAINGLLTILRCFKKATEQALSVRKRQ